MIMTISKLHLLILFCSIFFVTSCSDKNTEVETLCKNKPDYGRCVTDKDYFVSLSKRTYYEEGLLAEAFDQDAAYYNQYANQWLGSTSFNRSSLITPVNEDIFLNPIEANSLFSEPRKSKAEYIVKSIFLFDGHFVIDDFNEETNRISIDVYPLSGENRISISSFGFGTKEQSAMNFCSTFRQYRLPKDEFLCPATFIVSSTIAEKPFRELIYHLEAIRFPLFDKLDYLKKVEVMEIKRLEHMFERHQVEISKRNG